MWQKPGAGCLRKRLHGVITFPCQQEALCTVGLFRERAVEVPEKSLGSLAGESRRWRPSQDEEPAGGCVSFFLGSHARHLWNKAGNMGEMRHEAGRVMWVTHVPLL